MISKDGQEKDFLPVETGKEAKMKTIITRKGLLILFVGLLLVDYFTDFMGKIGETSNIELIKPLLVFLRIFLYFIVVVLALTQLNVNLDILYAFIVQFSWGISLGIGGAIALFFGWGLKDKSPDIVDDILGKIKPDED